MAKYILKRVLISIMTIFVLVTITFFLVRKLPGDPFSSEKMQPQIKENLYAYYGMDKPLLQQYFTYLNNLLHGDLGYSLVYRGRTVNAILGESFAYSADMGIRALIFSTLFGLLLGIIAAIRHAKAADYLCMIIAVIGVSVPSFIAGSVLQYIFAVRLKVLPPAQWDSFACTIMPVLALGLGNLALVARLMRANMLDVVGMDYIKTAKAKGLSPFQVTSRHQIRNAILPVVTVMGPAVANLLTGTFVIEKILSIPGMGRHYVSSIQNYDYTTVLGLTVFFGTFLVVMNLIVDILYGIIDPRIRVSK